MSTQKQEKFVKNMLENVISDQPVPTSEIARQTGYGKIAKQPSRIMKAKGVLEVFKKYGISPETIAGDYKKLQELKVDESKPITIGQKLQLQRDLVKIIIDSPHSKLQPQAQFYDKFINIHNLQLGQPEQENQPSRGVKNKVIIQDTKQ